MSNLNVIILAGGLGFRVRSLFPNIPKPLIPINGKPFIFYILDQLNNFKIKDVTISTGFLSSKVEKTIGKKYKNIKIFYSNEVKPSGTGGAIKLVKFRKKKDFCLVLNGDSYVNFNLNKLIKEHKKEKSKISIVLNKVINTSRFGSVIMDDNKIINFIEKDISKKGGYVNAGVYLFNSKIIDKIPNKIPFSLELDFFPSQIGQGLSGFKCNDNFIDIGTPDSLKKANNYIFNKITF